MSPPNSFTTAFRSHTKPYTGMMNWKESRLETFGKIIVSIGSLTLYLCVLGCAASSAQPATQEKPTGSQGTISQTRPPTDGQDSGGRVIPVAVLAALLAGAISGSVTLFTSWRQRQQQATALKQARDNLEMQIGSTEKNLQLQIESSRENIEKQIASAFRLKEQEVETNRYSLLMAIGIEAIDIRIRTSGYSRQVKEYGEDPTEDDLERLRISLGSCFNLNWDEVHLLRNPELYAHTIVLKKAIERASRRIDRVLFWIRNANPDAGFSLGKLLQELSDLYKECAERSGDIIKSVGSVSSDLETALRKIHDFDAKEAARNVETNENAQESVRPKKVMDDDTSYSQLTPRVPLRLDVGQDTPEE
jgi:hypothetical protein